MSDPLDLEALKDKLTQLVHGQPADIYQRYQDAEDALDRAIEIAEKARQDVLRLRTVINEAGRWLAQVDIPGEPAHDDVVRSLDLAREATDHYEQHRQAQEGEG